MLETTYGVIGPSRAFAGTLVLLIVVALRGWPTCPPVARRHIAIATVINLPLFILFAAGGELRNLSLLFPGLVILIACSIRVGERRSAPALPTCRIRLANDDGSSVAVAQGTNV